MKRREFLKTTSAIPFIPLLGFPEKEELPILKMKNGQITNLLELLEPCKWLDFPGEDSCCFSFRTRIIDSELSLKEVCNCCSNLHSIIIRFRHRSKDLERYRIFTNYSRNPHSGKTYIGNGHIGGNGQDLRSKLIEVSDCSKFKILGWF